MCVTKFDCMVFTHDVAVQCDEEKVFQCRLFTVLMGIFLKPFEKKMETKCHSEDEIMDITTKRITKIFLSVAFGLVEVCFENRGSRL